MDRFRGVTVTSAKEPCPLDQLEARLAASLAAWRQEGVRAVWFQVSHEHAAWVPTLVSNGFRFHNADPARLALLRWIGEQQGEGATVSSRVCYSPQMRRRPA